MITNTRLSQFKSYSRINPTLNNSSHSNANPKISTPNQKQIPKRSESIKRNEEKKNIENNRNIRKNENNNLNKGNDKYTNKNEQNKILNANINRQMNEFNNKNQILKIKDNSNYNRNNNSVFLTNYKYKGKTKNDTYSSIHRKSNKVTNKIIRKLNLDNNKNESTEIPRSGISKVNAYNINSATYFKNYSSMTNMPISKRDKLDPPVKILDTESDRTRKIINYNRMNKNKSYSLVINSENLNNETNNYISNTKDRCSNIHQNNNFNNLVEQQNLNSKNSPNTNRNLKNIYFKKEFISRNNNELSEENNKNTIPISSTQRKNIFKIQEEMKKNEDKDTKKRYSYINSQNANNNKEIKDKKINGEKKDNMVIITRKEKKIYVTNKPPIIEVPKNDNDSKNNLSFTYILNMQKSSKNNTKSNTSNNSFINDININKENNVPKTYQNDNNSITYINSSSDKKETSLYKCPNVDSLNRRIKSKLYNNNDFSHKINYTSDFEDIKLESKLNNDVKEKDKILNKNDKIYSRNENQISNNNQYVKDIEIKEANSLEENKNDNKIDINTYTVNNNFLSSSDIKRIDSAKKLEAKIKELETKLDDLNKNTQPLLNTGDNNFGNYDNSTYQYMGNKGLSDITKVYLSSYLDHSIQRAELSDSSRVYMIGLEENNNNKERPILTGLTKEFLDQNETNKEIKEENEEGQDNI